MAASSLLFGLTLVLRLLALGPSGSSPPWLDSPGVEPRVWAVSWASPLAPVSSLPPLLLAAPMAPGAAGCTTHNDSTCVSVHTSLLELLTYKNLL